MMPLPISGSIVCRGGGVGGVGPYHGPSWGCSVWGGGGGLSHGPSCRGVCGPSWVVCKADPLK